MTLVTLSVEAGAHRHRLSIWIVWRLGGVWVVFAPVGLGHPAATAPIGADYAL
jgi:hypothetical protein